MKEKKELILPFFYLGGDVLLALLANLGILTFAFGFRIHPVDGLILSLTVLGIYILDRSYDAYKEAEEIRTRRSLFYKSKLHITFPLAFVFLFCSLTLAILYRDPLFLMGGIVIGSLVTLYLLSHYYFKKAWFPKEVLISLLYTLGSSYPIYFYHPVKSFAELVVYILFFLSVLSLVLLLSLEDFEWDQKNDQSSLALHFGRQKTRILLSGILFIGFFFACSCFFQSNRFQKVGFGYLVYFLCVPFLPKIFSRSGPEIRKIALELSYLPFLLYYFL